MSQFNEQDSNIIRAGAMGAIAYVSQAEPGFLATFKESMAAAKVLKQAPEDFRSLITGGFPTPPQAGSKDEMAGKLLEQLRQAVQVAQTDPATAQALREYVLAACQQVAEAAKGVSAQEQDAINRVKSVLDEGDQPTTVGGAPSQAPSQATPVGQPDPTQATPLPADPTHDDVAPAGAPA